MDTLNGFKELLTDKQHSEIKTPIRHIELSLKVKYYLNDSGTGYCELLINGVKGNGLRGMVEAAAAKAFVGRIIFIFITELNDGRKLITVPALFEKEPTFDDKIYLKDLVIKTYYHDDFRRTPQEVFKEHVDALTGREISGDRNLLIRSILELPERGLNILKSYK